MLSSNLGVRTVDVGIPQLAMHSVREMCAVDDCHMSFELFTHLFKEYTALEASLNDGDTQ
jgi:aspartyl aminopeptidase